MMKNVLPICVDCEFTGLHQRTTLISIGLCSYDGAYFYAELTDYDKDQIDEWTRINVINNLMFNDEPTYYGHDYNNWDIRSHSIRMKGTSEEVSKELFKWLHAEYIYHDAGRIRFYGDCLAYDYVLFVDLLSPTGFAIDLPGWISYIPIDLCTLLDVNDIDPDISREEYALDQFIPQSIKRFLEKVNKHNSLHDVTIMALCFDKLKAF